MTSRMGDGRGSRQLIFTVVVSSSAVISSFPAERKIAIFRNATYAPSRK